MTFLHSQATGRRGHTLFLQHTAEAALADDSLGNGAPVWGVSKLGEELNLVSPSFAC